MGRDNERLKKRGWHAEIPFEIATPSAPQKARNDRVWEKRDFYTRFRQARGEEGLHLFYQKQFFNFVI